MTSGDQHIDGAEMASALRSGIHRVIGKQEHLNHINVFPVADSDTGTNLSLSLSAALHMLDGSYDKNLGSLLAALADTLLDNARGNSGAILAQFFQGMSDSAGDLTRFTTYTFSKAVSMGSDYAHDALSKPREGTIISVIAAFATSIRHQAVKKQQERFDTVLQVARERVAEALAETPMQLEVLRKAGVVDAGAQGFAELIEGLSDYIVHGKETPLPDVTLPRDTEQSIDVSESDNTSQYRFCTECLISGENIDRRKLREALAELGDSTVLAGSKRKAKIHIHVDNPDTVFELARQFGDVSGEKADDMHRQQHATHDATRKFAVITDSAADICDDDMERLDIHMVPCRIQFGDRGYLDKVSITDAEFYEELQTNPHHPTTSQPAPGDFRRQFQFLASHFRDVLSVNLTSRASGTYEGARAAAKRIDASGQIHVVDTLNASVGQGQLVVFAAECAQAGLNIEETLRALRAQIPRTRTYALLENLDFAVRGGRIPAWVKRLADILHLVPLICTKPDGRVAFGGILPGRRNRIRKFARFIAMCTRGKAPIEVTVAHGVSATGAGELADALRAVMPQIATLKICPLGTALGVHGGPGTLLVATSPVKSAQDIARGID